MQSLDACPPPTIESLHAAQLFDETESLIVSTSAYLVDGWRRGDNLLVIARPAHWALIAAELGASGCPLVDHVASGRLVALDASTTMATFMANGRPDADTFRDVVGGIVERLAGGMSGVRNGVTVYGEIVDVLAARGNFAAAVQLEGLWNDLAAHHTFRLLCGYASANFGDERTAEHLHAICGAHGAVHARRSDLLASWLLANRRSRYHLEQQ